MASVNRIYRALAGGGKTVSVPPSPHRTPSSRERKTSGRREGGAQGKGGALITSLRKRTVPPHPCSTPQGTESQHCWVSLSLFSFTAGQQHSSAGRGATSSPLEPGCSHTEPTGLKLCLHITLSQLKLSTTFQLQA